ncbi:MAG TPA: hypothetical protein PKE00_10750, partial [Planctomycetota bacterium]|nr:hypothetical protein [Planctomycetota bacterium]
CVVRVSCRDRGHAHRICGKASGEGKRTEERNRKQPAPDPRDSALAYLLRYWSLHVHPRWVLAL